MENKESYIYESPDNGKTVFRRKIGENERELLSKEEEKYETCILCGKITDILKTTHIHFRNGYIEGAGQTCQTCYALGTEREYVAVPSRLIQETPNNYELGEKVRAIYNQLK